MEAAKLLRNWLDTVKLFTPGTRDNKVYRALVHGRVLFCVHGHIQVCRAHWQWEDSQERTGAFFWLPADNASQLEPAARAHLASIGKDLQAGQFVACPKALAKLARWEDGPAEALPNGEQEGM
jgi:hypothetical protein